MRGFTLVELVLTIALLGVLALVIAPNVFNAIKGYDLVSTRRLVLAEARSGMDRMTREIRLIQNSTDINAIASDDFDFEYPSGTSINYFVASSDLMRNSDILIENIDSLTFTYYDEAGSTTSTTSEVRSVGIEFTVDAKGDIPNYSLKTRVFIRDTGNNYVDFTSP